MAKIYQGGRSTTDIPQPSFRAEQMANRGVEADIQRNKQEALQMYEQGLKLQATDSMNSLFQEFGNNPQELAAKLNDLSQKMGSEIPDLNMRANFKTNFIIQSQSMINRAQANYDKIQYEKKRSSYFDTIQANNKSIQLAFENAFSGTASPDDLVSYQTAINQNRALINAKNQDGTYMFSDAQRLSMTNSIDKLASDSFESALLNMDDDKRGQFLNNLANDNVILLSAEDENKNIRQLNLKDAVDPTIYSDMKKSARILDAKIKKQKVAEWNANKSYSAVQLMSNPNEQNYKTWLYYNADASDKKKETMAKIAGFVPNEETETNFDGAEDAYEAIKELSNMPNSTMAEKNLIEDKAMEIVQRLHNSNHSVNEEGNIRISSDDLGKSLQMVNKVLSDNVFKKQISEMPDTSTFRRLVQLIDAPIMYISDRVNAKSKIAEIAQATMRDIQNTVMNPDMSDDEKRQAIHSIYRYGIESAIKAKYYWIPDLQNQPLIPDETLLNINGRQYIYKGIGDDIFLEVKE